nr:undecaprenyl-phosphate 4-deoxy-4-formamido-L-arabinose transferase [uncultured bacterium]
MTVSADIAVVIPAYNEAATIADVATRARQQVSRVIVVDDGSKDGTADKLFGLDVTLLRNEANHGKALSLWRGMQQALDSGATAIITLDADGQHQPEDIPRLLEAWRANPGKLIIASRLRKTENAPRLRLFANRFANFWVSWAAGYRIPDSQSGFRLYPAAVLWEVPAPKGRASCFAYESQVLIDAAWRGHHSVPVVVDSVYHVAARPSHYRPALDTTRIVMMIAWRLIQRGGYPVGLWRLMRDR